MTRANRACLRWTKPFVGKTSFKYRQQRSVHHQQNKVITFLKLVKYKEETTGRASTQTALFRTVCLSPQNCNALIFNFIKRKSLLFLNTVSDTTKQLRHQNKESKVRFSDFKLGMMPFVCGPNVNNRNKGLSIRLECSNHREKYSDHVRSVHVFEVCI